MWVGESVGSDPVLHSLFVVPVELHPLRSSSITEKISHGGNVHLGIVSGGSGNQWEPIHLLEKLL